ncbi:MAG: phage major capsid protein [Syntrophomonadaceae bacterium]|jgi:HK97 family phage major capsid protein
MFEKIKEMINKKQERKQEIYAQAKASTDIDELKKYNKEMDELNAEIRELQDVLDNFSEGSTAGVAERTLAVNGEIPGVSVTREYNPNIIPGITKANARSQSAGFEKYDMDKVVFRSGEWLSNKYNTAGINAEKCLRAAITGNRNDLNEAEQRALTPTNTGAILAPVVSSIIIDNLRQTDWMALFEPSIVVMETGEVKIPNITTAPTAIMHTPGEQENVSNPVITPATLKAKTIMVLCEVANELLQDSAISQGIILQTAIGAISNKLLQQVLYGTGQSAEIKGITRYSAESFADAGDKAAELDIFKLVTSARAAITKNNGDINAMLYDCDLETRLDVRTAEGQLITPPRSLSALYEAGKVLAHPSVATGDMLFMQADALFLGIRQGLEIQLDPYSSFDSNNTKFRVILRADAFANTAKMVYYSNIPAEEPVA